MQYRTINNASITLTDDSEKGKHFQAKFIQPGLAGYPGQYGNALIRKEILDKFVHTLRNKPVTINHKTDITEDDKVGEVFNVWFNPADGWYWCDGIITNKMAQNLIKKGWSVSCSYEYTESAEGGTENNIPYDIEFLDGEFTHLAIVNNPRYERANIVFNAKVDNGGAGSGDFGHAGRPGKVGGSEPAGTGRQGKYDEKYQFAKKEGYKGSWEDFKKSDIEAELKKENKTLKKVSDFKKPQEVNKKEENGIEIKRETQKAYLLSKDGVNFWVQKRWYKDGKLTPAGEKNFNEAKEQKKRNEENKSKFVKFKSSWESEKAYGVDVTFENNGDGSKNLYNVRVFVPKSQVKDGKIPFWLYEAKMREAYEKAGMNAYWGDYGSGFEVDNSKEGLYTIIDGELYEITENNENKTPDVKEYDMEVNNDNKKEKKTADNSIISDIVNNAIVKAITDKILNK